MLYKNNDIPTGYNNLAEISDNYLVWVRESKLNSGTNYSAYIQFLYPSPGLLFTDNYKIKNGDTYTLNANYSNVGGFSYITSYDVDYSLSTVSVDSDMFATDDYSRSDFPQIFVAQFVLVIILYFVINKLTKLVFKGGV